MHAHIDKGGRKYAISRIEGQPLIQNIFNQG